MYKIYNPIPLSPFFILILILNICNLNLSTFYFIDLMLSAAKTLAELNPNMTFIYVSGSGTDSTESGRKMCAKFQRILRKQLLGKDNKTHSAPSQAKGWVPQKK